MEETKIRSPISYFVSCPRCGHKLCKGEEDSHVIIKCLNCSVHIRIKINENTYAHIMSLDEIEVECNKTEFVILTPNLKTKFKGKTELKRSKISKFFNRIRARFTL